MGSHLSDRKPEALTRRMKTALARTMRTRRQRKMKMSGADFESIAGQADLGKGPAAIALAAPGPHAMSALSVQQDAVRFAVETTRDAQGLVPGEIAPSKDKAIDAVALVALACERLAPAVTRSAIQGKPTIVRVPDEVTAEVFRAALARTAGDRQTDRLVEVLVEN